LIDHIVLILCRDTMVSRAGLEPETLINNNVGGGGGGAPSGLQLIDPATLHAATNTMDLHTPATVGSNHTQAGASQHQHGASASHPAHMSTHGGPLASHHVHPLTTAQMQSQAQQQQAAIALGELEEAMAETLYRRSQAKLMIDCFNHSGPSMGIHGAVHGTAALGPPEGLLRTIQSQDNRQQKMGNTGVHHHHHHGQTNSPVSPRRPPEMAMLEAALQDAMRVSYVSHMLCK
jgi:hypothetical protein